MARYSLNNQNRKAQASRDMSLSADLPNAETFTNGMAS
jgi:hypothetical protein